MPYSRVYTFCADLDSMQKDLLVHAIIWKTKIRTTLTFLSKP